MEHEVYVPFSVGSVRAALAERERVARCVPGLRLDAADTTHVADVSTDAGDSRAALETSDTIEGRLRVRIGGSSITYRGSLTVTSRGDEFAVEGEGSEARGGGSVRLDLTVVPRRSEQGGGTRLVCTGTVRGEGRLEEFEEKAATAAGTRLLDRFGAALGESIEADPPRGLEGPNAPAAEPAETQPEDPAADTSRQSPGGIGEPGDNERAIPGIPGPETGGADGPGGAGGSSGASGAGDSADGSAGAPEEEGAGEGRQRGAEDAAQGSSPAPSPQGPDRPSVFDAEVPPPSLDPDQNEETERDGADAGAGEFAAGASAAEAAHARRTMIGRSAEEVDHAPPRGRYAPVPVAPPLVGTATLRWAAPAAAVVVAGAVVIGRALRRRR
jgi:carbon monoxide dehydrogenase subunit G